MQMSAGTGNRWKETVQSVFATVVVLVLLWFCRPSLFKQDTSAGGGKGSSAYASASDGVSFQDDSESDDESEEERETEYPTIMSMPICSDLSGSIRALQDARSDLLKVEADGESEAILAAATQYREVLQEVQNCYRKLKMRVAPDDLSSVVEELIDFCNADDRRVMVPFELGHLK